MREPVPIENILFIDIETVPAAPAFGDMCEEFQRLWEKKITYLRKSEQTAEELYERAGVYAEFGKIICISAGYVTRGEEGKCTLRVKSFADDDEKTLLISFVEALTQFYRAKRRAYLCAHNGKEFDFPYIARRMLINGLKLPPMLNVQGLKPWEVPFLDTMEMWKFGDYKHFTSLNLMAHLFGIPSPKDDIDGNQVAHVYYHEKNLQRIVKYCEKDVLTVAQLFLKLRSEELVVEMGGE